MSFPFNYGISINKAGLSHAQVATVITTVKDTANNTVSNNVRVFMLNPPKPVLGVVPTDRDRNPRVLEIDFCHSHGT